jgi:hypothetical protein
MNAKQIESVREGLRRNVRMGGDVDAAQSTANALTVLLRRDWALRVLDAWRAQSDYRSWRCSLPGLALTAAGEILGHACHLETTGAPGEPSSGRCYQADSPDAARHEAALAAWPQLTHEQCQEIGACP